MSDHSEAPKRPYQAPQLKDFGTVAQVTRLQPAKGLDGVSASSDLSGG